MPATVELWLTSTEAWLHRQDILTASLSPSERDRRDRLVDPRIGLRFALGRGLLRAVLASRLDMPPAAVEFEIGTAGKPRLASSLNAGGLRFNVSASEGRLAIALCTSGGVGVDLECHRAVSEGMLRAPSILSENERDTLSALPAAERAATFLRWWARKEAVAKADGRGVALGLRTIAAGPPAFEAEARRVQAGGHSFLVCDSGRVEGAYCSVAIAASPGEMAQALIRHVDYGPVIDRS